MKYTKELLTPLVAESLSIAEVIRRLGIKWSGGTQQHIRNLIQRYELDTSHFKGQGRNSGSSHVGGTAKLPAVSILIHEPTRTKRQKTYLLKRALLESGVEYVCAVCRLLPVWNSQPLVLQIDHINNDWADNRLENLRFICPNCHTQRRS